MPDKAGIFHNKFPRRFCMAFFKIRRLSKLSLMLTLLAIPAFVIAADNPFERIVVFGAGFSDPGNVYVLQSNPEAFDFDDCDFDARNNVPPYEQMDKFYPSDDFFLEPLISDGAYAKKQPRMTNGATWIEQFARWQGLSESVKPAFGISDIDAGNYAVGGARALDVDCRFNLSDQLLYYFDDFDNGDLSPRTLVVLDIGGNDVRDALFADNAEEILNNAIVRIHGAVETLFANGATHFLILNVPDIGKTPAVANVLDPFMPGTALKASLLTSAFNGLLLDLHSGLETDPYFAGIDVTIFDLYGLLEQIIAESVEFGIKNVSNACIDSTKTTIVCKQPDTYLFWDGVHPSQAVHGIIAQKATEVLLEEPEN